MEKIENVVHLPFASFGIFGMAVLCSIAFKLSTRVSFILNYQILNSLKVKAFSRKATESAISFYLINKFHSNKINSSSKGSVRFKKFCIIYPLWRP